jgi:hypothetical protein
MAGFGLPDRDGLFPGDPMLRVEKVSEGYGESERLAVMASRASMLDGKAVTVRGGTFVDADYVSELSGLTGVRLAWRDRRHQRWIAPPGSPLPAWADPALAGAGGEVTGRHPPRYAAKARPDPGWSQPCRAASWTGSPARARRGLRLRPAPPRGRVPPRSCSPYRPAGA